MQGDFERLLRDVPATFPRPDAGATSAARRRVLPAAPGRLRHRGRLSLLAAAAVFVAALVGFTAGHWLVPGKGAAATTVALAAMPDTLTFGDTFTLYGSVASGRAHEQVTIEARDCGIGDTYHVVGGATTVGGGAFASTLGRGPERTTEYRARWRDGASAPATVFVRPRIDVTYAAGLLHVEVWAGASLRGERAIVQEYDEHGSPQSLRTFAFGRTSYAAGGTALVPLHVPRGHVLRVVLPKIGPCFADGFSAPVST